MENTSRNKQLLAGLFTLIIWAFLMHKNPKFSYLVILSFILPFFCHTAGINVLNTRNIIIGYLIGIFLSRFIFG